MVTQKPPARRVCDKTKEAVFIPAQALKPFMRVEAARYIIIQLLATFVT